MCTCMGYRNPAYLAKVAATVDVDLRRPGRDGHRRRLVRARVARLRLRLPQRRRAARHARRGRADHAPDLDRRARRRWTASTTRSTARSAARCRCRTAASRCGSPAAARRRRCGSRPSTRSTRTSTARPRVHAQVARSSRGHCRDVGTRLRRDRPVGQLQRRHRRDREGRRRTGSPGSGPTTSRYVVRRRRSPRRGSRDFANGPLVGTPEQIVERLDRAARARA